MTNEYIALSVMSLIFLFAWFPSSIAKYQSFGWKWLASNRKPLTDKSLAPWGARAENAQANLRDNFPPFAIAIILLGLTAKFNSITSIASMLFVGARIVHMMAYIAGSVNIRFLAYLVGLISTLVLFANLF